jgi:hypothetical protein
MSDMSTVQLPPVPPGQEPPEEVPSETGPPEPNRRPRWVRVALIVALAIVLVATPLTLYALLHDGSSDTGGTGGVGGGGPADTPTVSVEPSVAPTGAPGVPAPDGRIPAETLRNATIDVPPWPADNLTGISGRVTFHNGEVLVPADSRFDFERHMLIRHPSYGDVDRDGATETVVQISTFVQGGSTQLVALDRDRKGAIVTLGTVVSTTGPIREIDTAATQVTKAGVVQARVADYQQCCGDETPQSWQARGYAWDGARFRQTTGPVSFPTNASVTETTYTAGELVFGPVVDNARRGTLTVTVKHLYGARPHHMVLYMKPPPGIERDGSGWPPVQTDQWWPVKIDLATPATGSSATYTFAFRQAAGSTGGDFLIDVRGVNSAGRPISEANPWDGEGVVLVRSSG